MGKFSSMPLIYRIIRLFLASLSTAMLLFIVDFCFIGGEDHSNR